MLDRFAQWLDITMSNRKINGRTLAKKLGLHDSAISRWRNGQGVPSLDTTMRLATALDVDPIRLAVTAGHMDGSVVHTEPLPLPDATAKREHVREQIRQIRGLSRTEMNELLEAYDRGQEAHS